MKKILYKVEYLKHHYFNGNSEVIKTELTQGELVQLLSKGGVSLIKASQALENGSLKYKDVREDI